MAPTDKSCYLYRKKDNKKVLVCQCNTDIKPEQSYSWVTEVSVTIYWQLNTRVIPLSSSVSLKFTTFQVSIDVHSMLLGCLVLGATIL